MAMTYTTLDGTTIDLIDTGELKLVAPHDMQTGQRQPIEIGKQEVMALLEFLELPEVQRVYGRTVTGESRQDGFARSPMVPHGLPPLTQVQLRQLYTYLEARRNEGVFDDSLTHTVDFFETVNHRIDRQQWQADIGQRIGSNDSAVLIRVQMILGERSTRAEQSQS